MLAVGGDAGRIREVRAYPTSFPLPVENQVTLGVGRTIKRDAVVVKVITDEGIVGWGESHHGRAHTSIATLVNDGLAPLIVGMDAADVVGVWGRIYRGQLASHGMGAAAAMAMSGIDMALWDIRGKAVGWPLYRLLGGAAKSAPAYAGLTGRRGGAGSQARKARPGRGLRVGVIYGDVHQA